MKKVNIAVVGATGAVGEVMLEVLQQRDFPVDELYPLASRRSAGGVVRFRGQDCEIGLLDDFDFARTSIALFSAGASVSDVYAPRAADAGNVVIDNTSRFRNEADIPLVVPEVNAHAAADYAPRRIIANPNCSTIQMVVVLKPLHDLFDISRVNVATYQAVSGGGRRAQDEMLAQTRMQLDGEVVQTEVYPKQIAFNALPQIDCFMDNGYTREEMKMVWETQKILGDEQIKVNPTTVRIPVVNGHSEAIHIEFKQQVDEVAAREALEKAPGIKVLDERVAGGYPTAVTEADHQDAVWVGRIRKDISHPNGLNVWVVADNLRKGAATNSVQIAELMLREYL
ncbi:MAG: aspartate-semialdehyde dehydrogenase [Chromatiales bacterium]|nr:aspartate-semialdehyde dehydrogenase [Chromatiales bacterium]